MSMEYRAIKEFCNVSSSKRIFAEQYVDEGVPFYRQKEIIEKGMHQTIEDSIYISEETYNNIKTKFGAPQEGDLLITAVGVTLGIPYVVDDEVFYFKDGNLIWLSNFDKSVNSKYVYYWFSSSFGHDSIYMRAIGSAQPAITIDIVKKYKLLIPDRKVQDRIVEILSGYDQAIENNTKRIKTLEQMAENLYKEWFVRFRFPGHENAEFEKENPKNWIINYTNTMKRPKTWRYAKLSEFGEFIRGKNITSEQMVEGEIPVISAGVEPSGYHNQSNVHGECITISASGANAGLLKYNLSDIWAADCSYYQNDENLWFVYNSLRFLQKLRFNLQCGAAQPHVYPRHINKISIIKPDDNLIVQYCNTVKPFYAEIYKLMKSNESLKKQRDLLLPRLMSGKLEV